MVTKFEILQKHVSEILGLEREIAETIEGQLLDKKVVKLEYVADVLCYLVPVLKGHIASLENLSTERSGGFIKDAVMAVSGMLAGMRGKPRSSSVSDMLREDFAALSFATASYAMLHTAGLALRDPETADLAMRNMQALTRLLMALSDAIPRVIVDELVHGQILVDLEAPKTAARNLHNTWRSTDPRLLADRGEANASLGLTGNTPPMDL